MSGIASMQSLLGLVTCCVVVALIATRLILREASLLVRSASLVGVSSLLLFPIGGVSICAYVRAVTGDFSVATLAASVAFWLGRYGGAPLFRRYALLAALGLYPMALGLGPWDPYALGYTPRALPLALLMLSVFAWRRETTLLPVAMGLGQLAFALGLYESDNLWDYVVDPWLVAACAFEWFRARRRFAGVTES